MSITAEKLAELKAALHQCLDAKYAGHDTYAWLHNLAVEHFPDLIATAEEAERMRADRDANALAASFQSRVHEWILTCFGAEIGADRIERNHRLLEESLEAVQAGGCSRSEAHQLVDYVFDRPIGELPQEVGGVMNTLAAFCTAHGVDMAGCGEAELARVWTKVEQIRAKQAAKPKHGPLPAHADSAFERGRREGVEAAAKALEASASMIEKQGADLDDICDAQCARQSEEMGTIAVCLRREIVAIRALLDAPGKEQADG